VLAGGWKMAGTQYRVSLKPIVSQINAAEKKLRNIRSKVTTAEKVEIDLKISVLEAIKIILPCRMHSLTFHS
jgi:hypothetical protein